ncbi:hypothetical protein ACTHRK_15885 [Dietzia cercidiphylli]|uniref:hypothetical protein n=1 Tax=Dietzia cercidiphylli TaxID=498199 RepID=UPI003F8061E2
MPRMTAMVFMAGVMLPGVAVTARVVSRARVMMLGYRRPRVVGAPGRVAAGCAATGVAVMIMWLTHWATFV